VAGAVGGAVGLAVGASVGAMVGSSVTGVGDAVGVDVGDAVAGAAGAAGAGAGAADWAQPLAMTALHALSVYMVCMLPGIFSYEPPNMASIFEHSLYVSQDPEGCAGAGAGAPGTGAGAPGTGAGAPGAAGGTAGGGVAGGSFFLRGVGGVGGDVSLLLLHALAPTTANVSQCDLPHSMWRLCGRSPHVWNDFTLYLSCRSSQIPTSCLIDIWPIVIV
jgi:hypothetical protein